MTLGVGITTFGKRSYGDAPLSFSARERGLERVEQRVDEELRTQEEALRAIPPGKRYLSEAEQVRAAGAAGPLGRADRESMLRAGVQQVGEELDRREEELLAIISGDALLVEAPGALFGDGRTRSLGERWEACEGVTSGVEEELDRREAAMRADPAGEEFLRDARLEVLGAADREAATLGDRARIVKVAAAAKRDAEEERQAAALRTATERAQAAAGRSDVQLPAAAVRAIHATGETHESGLAAVERTTAALDAAADQQLPTKTVVDTWNANQSAPGGIAAALEAVTAAAREEQKREEAEEAEKAAALRTATERAQAAAGRSDVQLPAAAVRAIHATGETHESGLAAVERTTAALDAAADQQLPTKTVVDTWNANQSAPGGIAAALEAVTAAAREEQKRKEEAEEAEKAAALRTATERAQAAAGRSDVQLPAAAVRAIHATGETHESGLAAVERTTAALDAAADQQLPTKTVVDTWNAIRSDPGQIAAALDAATAAAQEQERKAEERRSADLKTATEAIQVAAGRSHVQLPAAEVRVVYETGKTHESGLAAVERTTAALDAAADQQLPTKTVVDTWNAIRSDPGQIAAALDAATAAAQENIDRALDIAEREFGREAEQQIPGASSATGRRAGDDVSRLARLFSAPRAAEAFIVALDEQDPSSRTPTHPTNIDRALDIAEREFGREAEQQIPGASSATGRRAGDDVTEAADTDRHVQQVIDWLRTEVERQLVERTGAAARLDQRNRNSVRPVEKSPPVPKPARLVPAATWEDAELLVRALTDLEEQTEPSRLDQRARHAVRPVSEKTPPASRSARRVPDATQGDVEREQKRRQTEAAQRRRQERLSRVEQALSDPAEAAAFVAVLDAQNSAWRTGASLADINEALDVAEERSRDGRKPPSWQHQMVLETERAIPDAPSTACRAAGDRFDRTTEFGRAGWRVSQTLSDRALARAFAAEKPELLAPRHLAERLFDWLRTQLEKLFRSSRPTAPAGAGASAAEDQPRLTMVERYSQRWPERAADTHRPDFEKLTAGASACNKLFERASPRTTADPGELPAALAKPAPAWDDETVKSVTWQATPGVGILERTESRRIVDAHLDHYEYSLPEQYAHSAEWRAIRERAEEAVRKLLDTWRYKRKDDRKKREREATAINRACGREARHLHEKMIVEREAARPDWEVTVRIRDVQQSIRKEEADRRAREQEHKVPVYRSGASEPSRAPGPTRDRGRGR